jgi:predicted Zn-dependent protease
MRLRLARAVTIAVVLGLTGCAVRKPGDPLKPGFNVYSKEQDIQLGRQAAQEVLRQVDVVDNRSLQGYIDNVGKRLAGQPEAGQYPYEFTLINDPSINAFALPGGPVFVNTGLIAAAENEAQIAGVLAHEIAHVALRHGTSQASKANLLQLPAAVAGAVLGQGSLPAQLGQVGLGLGLNALILRYSRSAETEADALGARIMAGAGYNPLEMARFFEKLESEGGSGAPEFLSSHPNPGNRVKSVQAEIQTFPQGSYNAGTGSFKEAKALVAQLPNPRRAVQQARSSVRPTGPVPVGTFQRLDGSRFSVSYPQGWRVFGDSSSAMLTIAPQQALVQNRFGGVDVAYGAFLSYFFPETGRTSLRSATGELVARLRAGNPTMEVSGQSRQVRIDGAPGLIVPLTSASPFGGAETDMLVAVLRPEGLFYMVFIAPQQDWKHFEGAFDQMVRSIDFRG